jgi:hypothetical protein
MFAHRFCQFTAKWFVSYSLLLDEKRQKEQMNWQLQRLCRTDLAHSSHGLVMGSCETHSVLTFPIDKNGA